MEEQVAPGQTQTQKASVQKAKARTGNRGGIQKYIVQASRDGVRKTKPRWN